MDMLIIAAVVFSFVMLGVLLALAAWDALCAPIIREELAEVALFNVDLVCWSASLYLGAKLLFF